MSYLCDPYPGDNCGSGTLEDLCNDTFGATVLLRRLSIFCIWLISLAAVALDGIKSCCCFCKFNSLKQIMLYED